MKEKPTERNEEKGQMENRKKEKQDKKGTATKNSFCPKDRQDKKIHIPAIGA